MLASPTVAPRLQRASPLQTKGYLLHHLLEVVGAGLLPGVKAV